jgi:steroid 5-alpha reductase family enzyme
MEAKTRTTLRILLLFEAATFAVASLIHGGVLVEGYEHHEAHLAEAVIATVLLASLVVTWIRSAWTRAAGLLGQGFALLGTMVGLFTIAVGIGPRTVPDVAYHVGIVVVLAWGLRLAWRAPRPAR